MAGGVSVLTVDESALGVFAWFGLLHSQKRMAVETNRRMSFMMLWFSCKKNSH
jgi:hypothetical protein